MMHLECSQRLVLKKKKKKASKCENYNKTSKSSYKIILFSSVDLHHSRFWGWLQKDNTFLWVGLLLPVSLNHLGSLIYSFERGSGKRQFQEPIVVPDLRKRI